MRKSSRRQTGHEVGMEKWTDWSEGQVELFDILRKICAGAGKDGAIGIVETIKCGDGNGEGGRKFIEELEEMKERASRVEGLERDVISLKEELKMARADMAERPRLEVPSRMGSFEDLGHPIGVKSRPTTPATIPAPSLEYSEGSDFAYDTLVGKHNKLVTSYKQLMGARQELEDKLRAKKKSTTEWVKYANSLEKRIGRLQKSLELQGTAPGLGTSVLQPRLVNPSSTAASGPFTTGIANGLVPKPNHTISTTLASKSITGSSGSQPSVSHVLNANRQNDRPLMAQSLVPFGKPKDSDAQESRLGSRSSPSLLKLVTDGPNSLQNWQDHSLSSLSHDPDSTKEGAVTGPFPTGDNQHLSPLPLVAASPSSDAPVVVSARTVKKRKVEAGARPREPVKVKVEILSSSPIGLAGLQHESLDLDEIGEKYETPKKKRKFFRTPSRHTEQHQSYEDRIGTPSALRPASPNKRILPRTFDKEFQSNRRRLGAGLNLDKALVKDDENEIFMNELNGNARGEIPGGPQVPELRSRNIFGVSFPPGPPGQVFTPIVSSKGSVVTPLQRTEDGNRKRSTRPSPSAIHPRISTPLAKPEKSTKGDKKARASTTRKIESLSGRRLSDEFLNGYENDQKSFRAMPVGQLSLENFKVNPAYNQGYDYAFTDVVRGRDQRKCLPGCTKPDCCGDKFRKIVELTRKRQGKQTRSQEEDDERLLEEHMGDNRRNLRTMPKLEKEELLIQARTRELAQKTGKHRHAYERRRSPPGFWRTDFPTTQEAQADRAEAGRVEREMVQQRYEEAMRPGGRWLFRDE